jgi:hypothetical protein
VLSFEVITFQSNAGSIEATGQALEDLAQARVFQSHAGSIEANRRTAMEEISVFVSIPRWFD